jgi:hypothetical protein
MEIPGLYQIDLRVWDVGTVNYIQGTATGKPVSIYTTSSQKFVDTYTRRRAETYWEDFVEQIEKVRNVLLPAGFRSAELVPPGI